MNKTEAVKEFLTKVFDETLIVDLKDMLSIPRGLDFGIIILVCSGIELLGALNQGHLGCPTSRFTAILCEYFPSDRYQEYQDIFYNLFRCGVAHQAFIKPGTATARNPNYKHCHLKRVYVEGEDEPLLFIYPDIFADHFFQAVENFRNAINNDPQKIEIAHLAIEEIYARYPTVSASIELCSSLPPLPSKGVSSVTRMPQPTQILASDASTF
jgi:hypothetical protein